MTPAQIEKKLQSSKLTKVIHAKKHLGKVKWNEDPLAYQKKKRSEWD
jgi:hypothetical protein